VPENPSFEEWRRSAVSFDRAAYRQTVARGLDAWVETFVKR
jgi:hypothetical protein